MFVFWVGPTIWDGWIESGMSTGDWRSRRCVCRQGQPEEHVSRELRIKSGSRRKKHRKNFELGAMRIYAIQRDNCVYSRWHLLIHIK
jgi:hypothetical protein